MNIANNFLGYKFIIQGAEMYVLLLLKMCLQVI